MQPSTRTSTHHLTVGATEVRKEFVADHEAQAQREWDCLTLLAEHAPGLAPRPLRREDAEDRERMAAHRPLWAAFWRWMLLPGNGSWRRNPRGTTEDQAAHFLALVGHH